MEMSKLSFPLLSLPELAWGAIVECLNWKDKLALASSCRTLAKTVSAVSKDSELTVTCKTGWKGLSKILATNTIACKMLVLNGKVTSNDQPAGNNALEMLMETHLDSDTVPRCSFKGTTKLFINLAYPLPCLLPPNLARALPDLQTLSLRLLSDQFDNLQPIPCCTSLRKVWLFDPTCIDMPFSKHHTAEDLQKQLPNVVSLSIYKAQGLGGIMLQAWGHQLSELELGRDLPLAKLQRCTRLQSLAWKACPSQSSLTFSQPCLTTLKVQDGISETSFSTLLQVPFLRTVYISGINSGLNQDWSSHSCTWEELHLHCLHVVDLGRLPLHSLKGEGCLNVKTMLLPEPTNSSSLADVEYAMQCVRHAGIVVEGCHDWQYRNWLCNTPVDPATDAALATLLCAASSVVRPAHNSYEFRRTVLKQYPQTTTAIIKWACHLLQRVCITCGCEDESQWFWQALQCCNGLKTVELSFFDSLSTVCSIMHDNALLVAKHLVAPTHKSIMLVYSGHDYNHVNPELSGELQEQAWDLRLRLQDNLPPSVTLQGFEWCTMKLCPSAHQLQSNSSR